MEVYLMRHGEAVSSVLWSKGEEERPLTDEGRAQIEKAVPHMGGMMAPRVILSSPLARARETAELVARMAPEARIVAAPAIAAGAKADQIRKALLEHEAEAPVLLVSHMPDIPLFAGRLLHDPHILEAPIAPAEVWALETGIFSRTWGEGRLLWRRRIEDWA